MLKLVREYLEQLRANYALMQRAAATVSGELERMSISEIEALLDNGAAAHEFDREIEGVRLHFVLQEWPNGNDSSGQTYSVNASGLRTLFGKKPGNRFLKSRPKTARVFGVAASTGNGRSETAQDMTSSHVKLTLAGRGRCVGSFKA